jgi:hypothetical protein
MTEVRDHNFALNPYRRILAFFGKKYVFLMWHTGKLNVRAAYLSEKSDLCASGEVFCANPYLPETWVILKPGGNIVRRDEQSYVKKWLPITKNTFKYF